MKNGRKKKKMKQVIVVRKDLKMSYGKTAAQVAHAALGAVLENKEFEKKEDCTIMTSIITHDTQAWLEKAFTKVVTWVESEDEIYELANKAREANLPCKVIVDNGFTEFRGNKTTTCVAIGPGKEEIIDKITGHLPLL
jgi:PTH2 family peptidyl-tRNA hydrolase